MTTYRAKSSADFGRSPMSASGRSVGDVNKRWRVPIFGGWTPVRACDSLGWYAAS